MSEDHWLKPTRFETKRLIVSIWDTRLEEPENKNALVDRLSEILTPPVLAHLPPSMQLGPETSAANEWVMARAKESRVFLVETSEDGLLIGLVFLVNFPRGAEAVNIHLGYLLAESAWGKGIASELVSGLVAALNLMEGGQIVGGVGIENKASARVLEKSGFVIDPERSTSDTEQFVYTY